MNDSKFAEWVAKLIIKGEQAFLPGETIPADKRRDMRRRQKDQQTSARTEQTA